MMWPERREKLEDNGYPRWIPELDCPKEILAGSDPPVLYTRSYASLPYFFTALNRAMAFSGLIPG